MLYLIASILVIFVLAAIFGVGKNAIFTKPHTLSDAMIERTIVLSQRIMDNSPIGSKAWSESGDKFTAALNEQRRRAGLPPLNSFRQVESENDHRADHPD
jgi:hypothetical protein